MMIRRVWIKTIGENASIAITDRGKRRVTLPNCSACARPRLLRRAEEEKLGATERLRIRARDRQRRGTHQRVSNPGRIYGTRLTNPNSASEATIHIGVEEKYEDSAGRAADGDRATAALWRHRTRCLLLDR